MSAEVCLRLAWEADRQGRRKLRDSLLTLAVVESGPDDPWAERARARLVADRPGHYLAGFASVRMALADPRVAEARDRLRAKYPEGRIQGLLIVARAARGPYTGRPESLEVLLEELVGPAAEAENVRKDVAQAARGPLVPRLRSLRFASAGGEYPAPGWDEAGEDPAIGAPDREELDRVYQTVLLAIAVLLAIPGPASKPSGPA